MKKLIQVLIAILLSSTSFGAGVKYICKESGEDVYEKKSVILTQKSDIAIKEGVPAEFTIEIFDAFSKTPVKAQGLVETEDVSLRFKASNRKKISFNLYLDELDQATLYFNGTSTAFDCR